MKGEKTMEILEKISLKACDMAELLEFLGTINRLPGAKGRHLRDMRNRRIRNQGKISIFFNQKKEVVKSKERLRSLIRELEKEGVIKTSRKHRNILLNITHKGKIYLAKLKKRKSEVLPASHYPTAPRAGFTIVAFDIPEKEARKRQWLRVALKQLHFSMKQKSFWIGHTVIPEQFLKDLQRMKILKHVVILKIPDQSSFKKIEWT